MSDRFSEVNLSKRDVPSFIEPRPPLISNPFMRPRPQKGTNLMDLFEEDSECEEPELVQVYLRLKPCSTPSNLYEVRSDRNLITSLDTATAGHGRRTQHNVSKMYTFSHIFRPETTQKEIFEHVVKDNLKKLPEGRSFTLLTYGASGSGKTYTLMGTVASPGLVPRSLEYVFKSVEVAQVPACKPAEGGVDKLNYAEQEYELQWVKRLRKVSAPLRDKYRRMSAQLSCDLTMSQLDLSSPTRHYVWVSFIEIYNEGVYDLLAARDRGNATKLAIREDSNGNVYVKGATQAFVRSGEEAYDVMVAGKHQLQVAATGVHAHSSRSHCIFTITMITETESGCVTSCVRLCDLAGCERARRTRNTGARMQESRAINSSLHVLERCLHTLRRKQHVAQHALVPYRESKLTRLLGAGLSGARGEAVSMVVTLNPAPEYTHETRHVLQLAAVARDIQINNTISEYPSSLESSTQDTTIGFNSEIMKLRSDNERLHFELIQAQARNKELVCCMEETQASNADTMRELVDEAKEMTKQYYEAQLLALRTEMEEMAEEYENRITELSRRSVMDTPSRNKKITQLMTENAILEEKLTAERLARLRAEEEMQHLRACIAERDEKEEEDIANEDVMSVVETDSETEDDDPCNESLEPTFKKEDIERSRIIRQSIHSERNSSYKSDSDDSLLEKSDDTLKDNSDDSIDDAFTDNVMVTCKKASVRSTEIEMSNIDSPVVFGDVDNSLGNNIESPIIREVSPVVSADISNPHGTDIESPIIREDVNKSLDKRNIDSPLTQDKSKKSNFDLSTDLADIKLNLKGSYFFKNEDNIEVDKKSNRGTYCVSKSDSSDVFVDAEESNKENNDSLNKVSKGKTDVSEKQSDRKTNILVNKILEQRKSSKGNNSLAQFEQLELAAKECNDDNKKVSKEFGNINVLKEKKRFFDDDDITDSKFSPKSEITKDYFANSNENADDNNSDSKFSCKLENKKEYFAKTLNEDASNNLKRDDDYRSPSIVKDEVITEFAPSMIKKLLGKSLAHLDQKSNTHTFHNSTDSIDLFDSPHPVTQNLEKVEIIRKSMDNIVLTDSDTDKDCAKEIKTIETEFKASESPKPPSTQKESEEKSCKINNEIIPVKDDELKTVIKVESHSPEILKEVKKQTEDNNSKTVKDREPIVKNKIAEIIIKLEKDSPMFKQPSTVLKQKELDKVQDKIVGPKDKNIEDAKKPKSEITTELSQTMSNTTVNNTLEEFENIYKDITAPRATEFDLLISQETENDKRQEKSDAKYNLRKTSQQRTRRTRKGNSVEEIKEDKTKNEEILLESHAKCESKRPKRNLRLRRGKNFDEDDQDKEVKLKDIVNLQSEYCDVTMDKPAPNKAVMDIPSPEKGDENVPPMMGIQSCPSKSITRSRRKLFTPRAEPLEESLSQTGDSNERIRVPRPSYHRPRARRKL